MLFYGGKQPHMTLYSKQTILFSIGCVFWMVYPWAKLSPAQSLYDEARNHQSSPVPSACDLVN